MGKDDARSNVEAPQHRAERLSRADELRANEDAVAGSAVPVLRREFPLSERTTHPDYCVGERYDISAEKARCLTLIDEFARKPIDSSWPESPVFGKLTGKFNSRVQAKHIDHHLRQFGA